MAVGDLINFKYGTLSQIKQASLNNNTISISTDTGTIWLGNTNITSRVIDSYLSNNTLYISKISDDGTLSSEQVDLNFARFSDLPVYSAGSGIDISNGEISVILDTDVFEVVESLPTQNISTKKIYLVSNGDTSGDNMYNEWHYLGHGAWEILGSKNVGVNLRDYYTKTEIDAKGYLTSHQDITGKQNILTVGNGIDITNDVISCTLTVPEVVSELTNDAGYISTETDPIYSASAAAGITSTDITNWNSKTDNVGTITGITMNGASKGTSGVVNLGTVVTSETDPIYSASAAAGITSTDITNWNSKQDALVGSGTGQNIKTVNSNSLLGSGNISIATPGTLITNASTAQTAVASESLSGTITLHKVSKTGSYNDLNNLPNLALKADLASPTFTGTPKAPTATAGTNDTQIATTEFVQNAISNLPEPMVFKGTLGTGGTITSLPVAAASNEGHTYKVITEITSPSIAGETITLAQAHAVENFDFNKVTTLNLTNAYNPTTAIFVNYDPSSTERMLEMEIRGNASQIKFKKVDDLYVSGTGMNRMFEDTGAPNYNLNKSRLKTMLLDIAKQTGELEIGLKPTTITAGTPLESIYEDVVLLTLEGTLAKVGDTVISNGSSWVVIPSGDESSGTVTSVGMTVPTGLSVSGSPITSSGTLAVTFANGYSIPTTTKQGQWDTAYTNNHTHSNKTVLDGIASTDISNWNSKTDNVGTITGITMNNTSKGTSGVVDLGTVITSETQLSKGTATGSGNAVTDITVSGHEITLTKGKTFLESFTETDPVYSASAAAGITSTDITNWNSKTDNVGTITGITMNGASKGTSGVVDLGTVITSETSLSKGTTTGSGNAVTDITVSGHEITLTKGTTFLTEHQSLTSLADGIWYDSTNKRIYLKNGSSNLTGTYSYIDATDFIKDGMVDSVTVGTGTGTNAGVTCLLITFNTFDGTPTHETIELPISQIFNPTNYYTKTDIDNAGYLTSETDPIFSASAASGITSTDITNWNSKTNNVGTITGITMNNTSKGTSGVVDLGTVVTSETDPIYSASAAAGITSSDISNWNSKTNNVGTITGITMNGSSKGTSGVVNLGTVVTSETDPVYSASAAAGITSTDITNWNSKTDNVGTITGITMNGSSKGTSGVVNLGTVITSETQLSKGTTTGSGNAVTDITVSNHKITLTKGSTFLTAHQNIKTINNNTLVGTGNVTINELPTVSSTDNGKVLQVVNGTWTLVSPVTLYSGSGTPSNAQGNNGDLYMQI